MARAEKFIKLLRLACRATINSSNNMGKEVECIIEEIKANFVTTASI